MHVVDSPDAGDGRRTAAAPRSAERIEVTGVVQGVGFRPFVYRLATELGLDGAVANRASQVVVDVEGDTAAIGTLVRRLTSEAPPLARIESVIRGKAPGPIRTGFRIAESLVGDVGTTLVSPDIAVCDDCIAELFDPADRRLRHPFITCTNCGPRFTIIRDIPYDRPNTTMAEFDMCGACRREYDDPSDRRHHAQPISCHDCGPQIELRRTDGSVVRGAEALVRCTASLRAGEIVAVKGLGGFHLAGDATADDTVTTLRLRKHRPDKPFAVMARDLDQARDLAFISDAEANLLTTPARPIVLVRSRPNSPVARGVAPDNPLIGVMLPYTPVHHLLFEHLQVPLVMTSANLGGEPIIHRDSDATRRLLGLCDAVLTHDRPIEVPCDDSVVRVVADTPLSIRRARGYAPIPVPLAIDIPPVLAVGGELKNTFCLAEGGHAWVSQHIGNMENLATLDAFEAAVDQFRAMYQVSPELVAVDAHPAYLASKWARIRRLAPVHEVQHHHAHVAAVMAEHKLDPAQPVIGFAFDGTGYGPDGTIWGGEVLVADAIGFDRVAHLAPVLLPGGDAAVRNPYRVALSHLQAVGVRWDESLAPVAQLDPIERGLLRRQLDRGVACVPTTSMGRLFDAVASLLDLRHRISYEAQAAIECEIAADRSAREDRGYRFVLEDHLMGTDELLRAMVADVRVGIDVGDIAYGFHVAVADAVVRSASAVADQRDITTIVLSGGTFQNALLTQLCLDGLTEAGLDPVTHSLVPPNDGGLSLGQAYVAGCRALATPMEEED